MRKISANDISSLYQALLLLRNEREAKHFLRDLLTPTEIEEFAERWKVARMIASGVPYARIIDETGLSSTTIARVARWVKRGTGGYRAMLKRVS